jgi:acetoin utilization deacetylase AcuC-like enzyme
MMPTPWIRWRGCCSTATASGDDRTGQQAADRLCGGKLVMVHEGGYAESYVPFCGLAVMEALSGVKTEVEDPLLEFIQQQQPREAFTQLPAPGD